MKLVPSVPFPRGTSAASLVDALIKLYCQAKVVEAQLQHVETDVLPARLAAFSDVDVTTGILDRAAMPDALHEELIDPITDPLWGDGEMGSLYQFLRAAAEDVDDLEGGQAVRALAGPVGRYLRQIFDDSLEVVNIAIAVELVRRGEIPERDPAQMKLLRQVTRDAIEEEIVRTMQGVE